MRHPVEYRVVALPQPVVGGEQAGELRVQVPRVLLVGQGARDDRVDLADQRAQPVHQLVAGLGEPGRVGVTHRRDDLDLLLVDPPRPVECGPPRRVRLHRVQGRVDPTLQTLAHLVERPRLTTQQQPQQRLHRRHAEHQPLARRFVQHLAPAGVVQAQQRPHQRLVHLLVGVHGAHVRDELAAGRVAAGDGQLLPAGPEPGHHQPVTRGQHVDRIPGGQPRTTGEQPRTALLPPLLVVGRLVLHRLGRRLRLRCGRDGRPVAVAEIQPGRDPLQPVAAGGLDRVADRLLHAGLPVRRRQLQGTGRHRIRAVLELPPLRLRVARDLGERRTVEHGQRPLGRHEPSPRVPVGQPTGEAVDTPGAHLGQPEHDRVRRVEQRHQRIERLHQLVPTNRLLRHRDSGVAAGHREVAGRPGEGVAVGRVHGVQQDPAAVDALGDQVPVQVHRVGERVVAALRRGRQRPRPGPDDRDARRPDARRLAGPHAAQPDRQLDPEHPVEVAAEQDRW